MAVPCKTGRICESFNKECSESFWFIFLKLTGYEACGLLQENMKKGYIYFKTNLRIFVMVTKPRFTGSPAWTVEDTWQFVADCFQGPGPFPQIQIVVQLEESQKQKSNINMHPKATVSHLCLPSCSFANILWAEMFLLSSGRSRLSLRSANRQDSKNNHNILLLAFRFNGLPDRHWAVCLQ